MVKIGKYNVDTTRTKVILYDDKENVVGVAGVQNPKDFDFNTLFNIAKRKSSLLES